MLTALLFIIVPTQPCVSLDLNPRPFTLTLCARSGLPSRSLWHLPDGRDQGLPLRKGAVPRDVVCGQGPDVRGDVRAAPGLRSAQVRGALPLWELPYDLQEPRQQELQVRCGGLRADLSEI